jgi:mono/diheme cytochrome c family protein
MRGVLGLTTQETIAFVLAAIALVGFAAGLAYVSRERRRARKPDIPPVMQPGPSDQDLEKPLLEKLQGWALASFLFMAVWVPLVWLREPSQNLTQERDVKTESIERGAKAVQLFSETNILGVGCVRCHGDDLTGGQNLFNGRIISTPDLTTVCGGPNTGHALIHNDADVFHTIEEGRPGTDMPSWSVRFQGGLDDQQIEDIFQYLVSVNEKKVPVKENVCINPNAKGYEQPVEPAT